MAKAGVILINKKGEVCIVKEKISGLLGFIKGQSDEPVANRVLAGKKCEQKIGYFVDIPELAPVVSSSGSQTVFYVVKGYDGPFNENAMWVSRSKLYRLSKNNKMNITREVIPKLKF
jgi:hypothetical protein